MRKIAVVTDDAAALPGDWPAAPQGVTGASSPAEGLAVVGMPVMVDDQIFPLDEPELPRSLLVALAEGRKVTTSRPSPGQFRRVYAELEEQGFDGIVSVHLSSELSGTVSSARIGRQSIGIPVTVVDSRTVAMDQGYGVMAAWEAAGRGADQETVVKAAREGSRNTLLLYVPTLEQLRRGGRLAPSIARIGSVLQVKPLLTVKDGRLALLEMPRTAVKAKSRFLKLATAALDAVDEDPEIVVHHLSDPGTAHDLGAEIAESRGGGEQVSVVVSEVPPVLAAHVGIGVRAVVVRRQASETPQED